MGSHIETWFRGEGEGVPPAKPGGFLHDFGDGLYLTDTEDVAKVYARRRAPAPEDQRVWMVELERSSLGRVLDLSADGRWVKFMNEPISANTKSRLFYLRIKQELYDQFFKEFLSSNNLNIKDFDAVIGPEYNLGGNQLCILHKDGMASRLSQRIRALFRPTNALVHAEGGGEVRLVVRAPVNPKIGFLKGAVGFFVGAVILILLNYLVGRQIQKIYNDMIEKQLKALEPDVQASLQRQRRKIMSILDNGQKAYAIVNVEISYFMSLDPDPEGGGWDQSAPGVELKWVDVRDYKVEGAGDEHIDAMIGQRYHTTPYTMASELIVSKDDLDRYRAALEELDWYETTLRDPHIYDSDKALLTKEQQALEKLVNAIYGDPPPKDEIPFEALYPPKGGGGFGP
jgi:hypothetical protein